MIPESCSFLINKIKCTLPPEFIMEINDGENNKFMVGLSCFEHKQKLEEKFRFLQIEKHLPEGKIIFTPIKKIHTNCVVGNQEDVDEIQSKRL